MSSHNQLLFLDPLLNSSSHTSITTVSFRCLGSFARCGFSVRVCQTSTWKREVEEWGNLLTVEKLVTKKEWTGCYAWINTAQMQVDGRALLIPWKTSGLRWYFFGLKLLIPDILCLRIFCVCRCRKMSDEAFFFRKSWCPETNTEKGWCCLLIASF